MTEQEAKMAQKVQLYDLRLIFTSGDKDTYTTQEIVELLYTTAYLFYILQIFSMPIHLQ